MGSGERDSTGHREDAGALCVGAAERHEKLGADAICGGAKPGRRICLRAFFNSIFPAAVSGRSNGTFAGNRHAVDDDHATADEAD